MLSQNIDFLMSNAYDAPPKLIEWNRMLNAFDWVSTSATHMVDLISKKMAQVDKSLYLPMSRFYDDTEAEDILGAFDSVCEALDIHPERSNDYVANS